MSAPGALDAGIERLALFFTDRRSRAGLLARTALDRPRPDDPELRRALLAQLSGDLRPDGSVGGAVLATAWRLHELLDLGHGADQPETRRVAEWLLELAGEPGAFGEGCAEPRHHHRACMHWMSGFISPAPPTQRVAPITFPNGKVFRAEPAARFAVSCLALRALVRAGLEQRPLVQAHLVSLERLEDEWERWGSYYTPDLVASGLAGVSAAAGRRAAAHRVSAMIAAHQEPDGSWDRADLFHLLEALAWTRTDPARTALRRAAPLLLERQRPDGSFAGAAREERAWIALRALLAAG